MSVTKYCLNWDAYENNICVGLAKLQQSEEFVDMTLVADGHLVKVHKNLLALASPYIKQIISKTPCEHPVIFFSNISHDILCYILEYIYTGQVKIEIEKLQLFLKAATELCLPTIGNDILSGDQVKNDNISEIIPLGNNENNNTQYQELSYPEEINLKNHVNENGDITISLDQDYIADDTNDLNNIDDLIQFKNPPTNPIITYELIHNPETTTPGTSNLGNANPIQLNLNTQDVSINVNDSECNINPTQLKLKRQAFKPQQYTVSNRGSLQIIMNRYIYSSHHQAMRGRKRRWRCIDYRLLHCKAFIDTMDETIVKRINIHTHPYHDMKIMKKIKANLTFGSITNALDQAKKLNSLNKTENMEESAEEF